MRLGEREYKLEAISEMERLRDETHGRIRLEYEQIIGNWQLNYWRQYCPIVDFIRERREDYKIETFK